jgi:hypothetical protein
MSESAQANMDLSGPAVMDSILARTSPTSTT